jgi:hypothetical protein
MEKVRENSAEKALKNFEKADFGMEKLLGKVVTSKARNFHNAAQGAAETVNNCVKELVQRKPAITVSNEGVVVRKLLFAGANLPFTDIEEITKTEIFGLGNRFKFRLKPGHALSSYDILIYNNQHLNCSIEANEVVEAIKAVRPGVNLQER